VWCFFYFLSKSSDVQKLYSTSAGGVGAVYTMSNAPTMNQVLIHSVNGNGQLTMVSAINTNETGVSTTSSDPLFSHKEL
jgi:hypothetical protein